ncbi:hypothetical protein [Actinoplanes sp. NBRC 103695]|uniref:hypothetical protein n=1 Tax=Actinoplanes sp. NBRC 103695 TaxID=3032202 RepID=UPI0024A1EE9B|nr:hypothetical protein [Actinoplanes sp. NBRC 103695]GLZ00786.1 hypothetical protein Acsp02_80380 [Actinoplanes sp. NBRC 103695]
MNNSDSCAYEGIAYVPDSPQEFVDRGIGVIPPGVTRIRLPVRSYIGEGSSTCRRDGDFANNQLVSWIQFRDQAGIAWRRGRDGTFLEATDPLPFPDHSC